MYLCVCLSTDLPPHTAPTLGYLFEYYMFAASAYSVNRLWLTKHNAVADGTSMSEADQTYFQEKCIVSFYGWLLMQVAGIGSAGRRQMFYLTFIAKYFGLSREGIDILAAHGYGVTLDMFDRFRAMYAARAEEKSRYKSQQ